MTKSVNDLLGLGGEDRGVGAPHLHK